MAKMLSSAAEPFPYPLRTRDIRALWMVRHLVHIGSDHAFSPPKIRLWNRLRLGDSARKSAGKDEARTTAVLAARLEATLKPMEARKAQFHLPATLFANLELLRTTFAFSRAECMILAWAVLLRFDEDLHVAAVLGGRIVNPPRALGRVLGLPAAAVARALASGSLLRRSCLIDVQSDSELGGLVTVRRGGLRRLASFRFHTADELMNGVVRQAPAPTLKAGDYAHLSPSLPVLQRYLADALKHRRVGVNVLLHGAPGTGKSELTRVLAREMGVQLLEVADRDEDGDVLNSAARLAGADIAQFLLEGRKVLLCFDEVEAVFNDGSRFFGKPSTAEAQKSAFNLMLERNPAPMFWVANTIDGIDAAFARRFDLIIRLEAPPQAQRLRLLERECGQMVSQAQLRRLSQVECITPAVVARAARVMRHTGLEDQGESEKLLETVLDGVLRAQRHPPLAMAMRDAATDAFDPAMCNCDADLAALADGLAANPVGRICLYGPPGTGKTAFGRWLAGHLQKPLLLKRCSDLQSPYLGMMERNLAGAFEQARRDGAVLQIDEVDSFLQDRRQAQRPWEISQVNEFLTQLESFEGVFIASTNLMDNLDQASLRRFDFKLRMDYLRPAQALAMLRRELEAWNMDSTQVDEMVASRLAPCKLAPGDFAVVARRHRIAPFAGIEPVVEALRAEAAAREPARRAIGFVWRKQPSA